MWQRILALILKELAGLWKDPKTRFVILVPPVVQVLLFAYAATYDVTNVPLGVWNEDPGIQASELVRRFAGSPAFHVSAVHAPDQVQAALDSKTVAAVLRIPQRFSADLLAGRDTSVQFIADARRSNTALMVQSYAASIVAGFAQDRHQGTPAPMMLMTRDWFNPTLESSWFILPGLVAVLSMLMSMLISALSLARERELGTFEQLLVTPLRPAEVLVGKAVPGMIVGMIDANLIIVVALLWFRLPFRGNALLLETVLLLYTLAGVGIGLALSAIARTQQQAMLGVFVFASPMVVLSGYAAPVENMPPLVEWIGRADPIRYMMVLARALFLQDPPLLLVWQQSWPLAVIALVTLTVAAVAARRAVG